MKTIDREIVKQYRKKTRDAWWWLGAGILLIVFGMVFFAVENTKTYWDWGWPILALGAIALGTAFSYMEEGADNGRPDYQWQHDLLSRWVQHSGQSISKFPSSSIGSKYLEKWAIEELTKRAQELNYRYSREDDFYKEEKQIDWESLEPVAGEAKKRGYIEREKWMKAHIQSFKQSFLGLWDLVTEKNGIGILTGPDWQDPEVFRQKVLVAGDPCMRIGFNGY